ncbi:MAG: hypothetical protein R3B89_00485 [Polyangiaceae bacterium]
MSGRLHAQHLLAGSQVLEAGHLELTSPGVGWVRDLPRPGSLVTSGQTIGYLEVLGQLIRLEAPHGVHGIVGGERRRTYPAKLAVGHGDRLLELEPVSESQASEAAALESQSLGLVFRAPTSGRFYTGRGQTSRLRRGRRDGGSGPRTYWR